MVDIIQDFIPEGRRNRPGRKMKPEWITVHDTANPSRGADALAHAKYLKGSAADVPASWHFTVDDVRIVQHLPLDEIAWHAGDGSNGPGNTTSVALEICENADGDRGKAEKNAAELVAMLLKRLALGIDHVVPHKKWTGKDCPHLLLPRWDAFLEAVKGCLAVGLTPILGEAVATLLQARAWLRAKNPDWVMMADLYYAIAPRYGVRPDVALAQACKETGFFRFGGLVQAEQNNFCGLGATGADNPGHSFPDRATGVEAHVQHLYAYATTEPLPAGITLVDPRFSLVKRGSAPYVEWLGASENPTGVGWAHPGVGYGASIVRDYLGPLIATPAENETPEPDWKTRALAAEDRLARIALIAQRKE